LREKITQIKAQTLCSVPYIINTVRLKLWFVKADPILFFNKKLAIWSL